MCRFAGFAGVLRLGMGEPVGLGSGLDDGAVVGEPVDDRSAQAGIGDGLGPVAEGLVGGDRDAGVFRAFGQELEEQFGTAPVQL
jgi:hypothetical protein